MKRLEGHVNEPELFNKERYLGNLACYDMEREYLLNKHFAGGRWASVGCLNSVMPVILAESPNDEIYGIDFAGEILEFLRPRFPKVNYITHDIREGMPDIAVDYIVAGEVIEHMEDPKKFVEDCLSILLPGGWLAISTPWEEGVKQSAVDREAHLWSFSEQDIKDLGFTEVELLKEGSQTSILAWQQK